jgi:integrase
MPRLVFVLALCTGAAAVDLVRLGWHCHSAERIQYRRQKTERRKGHEETPIVSIPVLEELRGELALVPLSQMTFLEHAGRPRSEGGLNHSFREWVDAVPGLEVPDRHGRRLTLHGLRKALGRRLAERGASPHMLMAWLGHESLESVQGYARAYDRETAADAGAELLGAPKPTNVTRLKR